MVSYIYLSVPWEGGGFGGSARLNESGVTPFNCQKVTKFFCFWTTPDLVLALSTDITHGGIQETLCSAMNQTRDGHVKGKYLVYNLCLRHNHWILLIEGQEPGSLKPRCHATQ